MPTSMVLRFRDLVAPTIVAHRELIKQHGYVWWGWWNRPNEMVPRTTFAQFKQIIDETGLMPIYLVDSGQNLLFKAILVEIDDSPTEKLKPCREADKTPSYYKGASYKAWFRFTAIDDVEPGEIRNWSYDESERSPDDTGAARFHNKRVFNIQEMLNRRHQTIYFIQRFSSGHQDYNLELLAPILPGNFMTAPIFTESTYVLHLSDPHFSPSHHEFALEKEGTRMTLSAIVIDALRRLYKDTPPGAVIMSGDITWQGQRDEFASAEEFIRDMKSVFGLESHHFVVVPGNHDVQWAVQEADEYDRSKPVDRASEAATENYRTFYRSVFGLAPTDFMSMGRRYVLGNYTPLDVIGLNSSLLEQKHFAGYGYVSRAQLDAGAVAMGWRSELHGAKYRILTLHHHVIAVTPEDDLSTYDKNYSLTMDAGQLIYEALELEVDLIAHGHMHQPFSATVSRQARGNPSLHPRSLAVHAAGSAGVKRDHTGAIGKNAFSVYNFDHEGVTTTVFATSESANRFDEDWKCLFVRNPAGGLMPGPVGG